LKNSAPKLKIIRNIYILNRFNGLEKTKQISCVSEPETIQEKDTEQIDIKGVDPTYAINSDVTTNIIIDEALLEKIDGPLLVSVAQTDPSFQSASYLWHSETGKDGVAEKKGIIQKNIGSGFGSNRLPYNPRFNSRIPILPDPKRRPVLFSAGRLLWRSTGIHPMLRE
jgi:hypothetical protein